MASTAPIIRAPDPAGAALVLIVDDIEGVREQVRALRNLDQLIAYVPTMGNLHRGHVALIRKAKACSGPVVVSLFVNPLQFGANEDFSTYPRTFERDHAILMEEGVDLLFCPDEKVMYPFGLEHQTKVEVPFVGGILEGVTRPHFFRGVATVVNRLFNIVQADVAVFGKKDYQQWVVIKRMVEDLAIPVEIVGVDTVREEDGLALSSRNSYLSDEQRRKAPLLYRVLQRASDGLSSGQRNYVHIEQAAVRQLAAGGLEPDYISVRRRQDLKTPDENDTSWVVLGAAYLGKTRLIDNIEVGD